MVQNSRQLPRTRTLWHAEVNFAVIATSPVRQRTVDESGGSGTGRSRLGIARPGFIAREIGWRFEGENRRLAGS
jgi:hypothetical protein